MTLSSGLNESSIRPPTEEDQIQATYETHAERDFMCFVRGLVIAAQVGPTVFERCLAPFQRDCFEDLAPSLHQLRDGSVPDHRRWWIERTKKAAKDSDLAVIILWLLAFARRPFYIQVGAADKTQAAIVKERMSHLLHWNSWLNEYVELIQWEVRSKKMMASGQPLAKLEIMSSDISGAHGGTPDLLVVNELSHVTKWEFVENLLDNADGVAQGMVIIATNAGYKGTKVEVWRLNALSSDDWMVHVLAEPAPWHDKASIKDAEARNTRSRFLRLWKGQWPSGKGDALREEDIDALFCLPGPTLTPEDGWTYLMGMDLGISHDHSAIVVVGVNVPDQMLKLAYWKAWVPQENGEVDLMDVESVSRAMARAYNISRFYYDPFQAKLMAQRLKRSGVPMDEMSFSSPMNLTKMATDMIQVVENHRLMCYDDPDGRLRHDFGKFTIVEKPYGYKLEAVSDESGHADVGTALAIIIPPAVEMLNGLVGLRPEDTLVDTNDKELTDDEVEGLPDELRGIYSMDDNLDLEFI